MSNLDRLRTVIPGLEQADLANGGLYVKLHHHADPGKDDAWLAQVRKEMPERQFMREILMDDTVYEGDPVHKDYIDALHAPVRYEKQGIPIVEGSRFWGGWDCGNTLSPAFALAMETPGGLIAWILEVVPIEAMAMHAFAPIVMRALQQRIPGYWMDVVHIGDPAGTAKAGSDGLSSYDVAHQAGFTIMPCSEIALPARLQAVAWGLRSTIKVGDIEIPKMIYDRRHCPVLVEGMRGAYCMQISKRYESSGPGMVLQLPAKNSYSHVQDGHAYAMIEIHKHTLYGGSPNGFDMRG